MNKEILTVKKDNYGTIRHYNASGQLHNPNGPALVCASGYEWYYINGKRHNPNGPAIVWPDGSKEYRINDNLHNANGPAVIHSDGREEYWVNGELITETEFKAWRAQ